MCHRRLAYVIDGGILRNWDLGVDARIHRHMSMVRMGSDLG